MEGASLEVRRWKTGLPCLVVGLLLGASAAAADDPLAAPEEAFDRAVEPGVYEPVVSSPLWVVPSPSLPAEVETQPSNNNLAIALHEDRLFFAWRTAPTHFASEKARLYVASSPDMGHSWTFETSVSIGKDLREPFLLSVGSRLFFYFAELGTSPYAFEPSRLWRMERLGPGRWSEKEPWGGAKEMAWEFKVRQGRAWVTSYRGKHYGVGDSPVDVLFRSSRDGIHWSAPGGSDGVVYRGGVSEAAFEFDETGRLWAITRNEDGDETGFGSLLATAPPGHPGEWLFPRRSDPHRYDSPRMFRHGHDIYVVARRDLGPPIGTRFALLPTTVRKLLLWPTYSLRPKRTTLYRLDPARRRLVALLDLPSAGDTAFPSVARIGPHSFLIANYTSPLDEAQATWFRGQVSDRGTRIYFVVLRFEPRAEDVPSARAVVASLRHPAGASAHPAPVARMP
jgi:hypothetical protein